jgi:hypothetical protein
MGVLLAVGRSAGRATPFVRTSPRGIVPEVGRVVSVNFRFSRFSGAAPTGRRRAAPDVRTARSVGSSINREQGRTWRSGRSTDNGRVAVAIGIHEIIRNYLILSEI